MLPKIAVKTYNTHLPHTNIDVEFRPYIVKEERALLMANQDGKETEMMSAMLNLVDACIMTDGISARDLPDVDLQWVFIQIRSKSVGEAIEYQQKCDSCTKEFSVTLNTDDIQVTTNDTHDLVYKVDMELGNNENDLIIEFTLPTASTYLEASKQEGEVAQTFFLIESCIQKITYDGNTSVRGQDFQQNEVESFFEQLPAYHLEKIYSQVFESAPKITHEISSKCPHCGNETSYKLEGMGSFFG